MSCRQNTVGRRSTYSVSEVPRKKTDIHLTETETWPSNRGQYGSIATENNQSMLTGYAENTKKITLSHTTWQFDWFTLLGHLERRIRRFINVIGSASDQCKSQLLFEQNDKKKSESKATRRIEKTNKSWTYRRTHQPWNKSAMTDANVIDTAASPLSIFLLLRKISFKVDTAYQSFNFSVLQQMEYWKPSVELGLIVVVFTASTDLVPESPSIGNIHKSLLKLRFQGKQKELHRTNQWVEGEEIAAVYIRALGCCSIISPRSGTTYSIEKETEGVLLFFPRSSSWTNISVLLPFQGRPASCLNGGWWINRSNISDSGLYTIDRSIQCCFARRTLSTDRLT
jgi:hypothetical protein